MSTEELEKRFTDGEELTEKEYIKLFLFSKNKRIAEKARRMLVL